MKPTTDQIYHPIIFSGPMVRAILDGSKTQTRRVVKQQPPAGIGMSIMVHNRCLDGTPYKQNAMTVGQAENTKWWSSPYGLPGDRLWVREKWLHECPHCNDCRCGNPDHIWYSATENDPSMVKKWRPSIHMPRWASRITLEVTDIRVERVQDISFNDIKAEMGTENNATDARNFMLLWDSVNRKRGYGWDTNPWVWVVDFVTIEEADDERK